MRAWEIVDCVIHTPSATEHITNSVRKKRNKKMKKIGVAVVGAALCGAAIAVESSNTVGYFNNVVSAGNTFQLAGIQFDGVAAGANLADIVKPSFAEVCWDVVAGDAFVHEDWLDRAPQIQIPNGVGGYLTYYYVTSAWDDAEQDFTPAGVGVWADDGGMKVTPTAESGVGFWLKSPKTDSEGKPAATGCSFTLSGQVPGTKPVSRTGTGFTLAAIPAPVNIALDSNKITWNLTSIKCWNDAGEDFDDPGHP